MGSINVSCPYCKEADPNYGEIQVSVGDVTVRISDDDNSGTYSFKCPDCKKVVLKPAAARTIDLLLASGVSLLLRAGKNRLVGISLGLKKL